MVIKVNIKNNIPLRKNFKLSKYTKLSKGFFYVWRAWQGWLNEYSDSNNCEKKRIIRKEKGG